MTVYEVRNAQDEPVCRLATTRAVKAQHDRDTGYVWVAEVDSLGRRLAKGQEVRVGFDPLADQALTLVSLASTGKVAKRDPLVAVGEPSRSMVLMPGDDETSSAEQ